MSLEERINRLEERVAELLIAQATLNDRYDDELHRVAELEVTNEQLRQRLAQLLTYLDLQPEQLDDQSSYIDMANWMTYALKRRIN